MKRANYLDKPGAVQNAMVHLLTGRCERLEAALRHCMGVLTDITTPGVGWTTRDLDNAIEEAARALKPPRREKANG